MKRITKLFTGAALVAVLSLLSAAAAWGADVTFSYSDYKNQGTQGSGSEFTMNKTSVSIKNTKFYGNTSYAHFYANGTTTITPSSGVTITKISLTASSSSYNGLQSSGTLTASTGNVSGSGTTVTWSGSATSAFTITNNKQIRWTSIVVTYSESSTPSTPTCATPTFNPEAGSYTAAQNVVITTATDGATIYYTTDETNPTTSSNVYSSAISVSSNMTIKAIAVKEGNENSAVATAVYTIINLAHAGSETDPYTVDDAYTAIDNNAGVTDVYVAGIVSEIVTAYNSQYGNISYNISADGQTTGKQLQAYRGKGIGGADFTSEDDIQVGDEVVVKGTLKKYNSTYEFEADNQLVSLNRPVVPIIVADGTVNLAYDATSGEISYEVTNATTGVSLTATSEADWISNIVVTAEKVTFTTTANDGNADRTGSITLAYTGATSKTITVTQAHYVKDFADLPFEYDGNGAGELPAGLTVSGTGTYSSTPKIKFDTTGDYIILKVNDAPGMISFDIKGNPGSGSWSGTFKVQSSVDGQTYSDIAEYTTLSSSAEKKELHNISSDIRYIKWILTSRDNGNVALGNIRVTDSTPSISISPETATPAASDVEGTLDIAYANLTISSADDFDVQFCDAQGTALADAPEWITALVATQDPNIGEGYVVSYIMDANTGDARTAYLKVYALDAESTEIYSNLVTITQAAYVIDYATLDFEYDGDGTGDLPAGLTVSGTGTYTSSPAIKFDSTGDYMILKINEIPGVLTFDIKGNGFSGGTFTVQTSADGVTYTDLQAYTELGTTQSETFDNLAADVRYIKWIYTEKSSGNVALGNVKLVKPIAKETINLTATLSDGRYWTTFYNSLAGYTLPEGAQAFTMNEEKKLYRLGTEGNVVPVGTAVIIIADTANITLTKSTESAAINGSTNFLIGSNGVAISGITGTPYVLGIVGGKLGFYQYTGANIPAGKAYYVVNE